MTACALAQPSAGPPTPPISSPPSPSSGELGVDGYAIALAGSLGILRTRQEHQSPRLGLLLRLHGYEARHGVAHVQGRYRRHHERRRRIAGSIHLPRDRQAPVALLALSAPGGGAWAAAWASVLGHRHIFDQNGDIKLRRGEDWRRSGHRPDPPCAGGWLTRLSLAITCKKRLPPVGGQVPGPLRHVPPDVGRDHPVVSFRHVLWSRG